ncbi:hypothetical protein ACP70R_035889 [Stipagrostis hirtigluma subsp. patula]
MDPEGICNSPSGVELTLATPRHENGVKPSSHGSMANAGNVSSNNGDDCIREFTLLDTINLPSHGGGEEQVQMAGVEVVEDGADDGSSSQPRRKYTRYSQEQQGLLEAAYQENNFPNKSTKEDLAERLKVTVKQVDVWFVNHRARLKKQLLTIEQSKKQCVDYKQQIHSLTAEKCRLKRKLDELKEDNKELKATTMAPPPQTPVLLQLLPLPGVHKTLAEMFPNAEGSNVTTMAAVASSHEQHGGGGAYSVCVLNTTSSPPSPPFSGGSTDA